MTRYTPPVATYPASNRVVSEGDSPLPLLAIGAVGVGAYLYFRTKGAGCQNVGTLHLGGYSIQDATQPINGDDGFQYRAVPDQAHLACMAGQTGLTPTPVYNQPAPCHFQAMSTYAITPAMDTPLFYRVGVGSCF